MAVTFLECGGDADFAIATTNGFWGAITGSPSIATDFVHGAHVKSIKYGTTGELNTATGILADAGSRISEYLYIVTLPSATSIFMIVATSGNAQIVSLRLKSTGVLILTKGAGSGTQLGSDGSTLSTGTWYRISLAYTITSSSVNEVRVYVNGVLDITSSNTAALTTGSTKLFIGNNSDNAVFDLRTSDHYIDDSSALTDTGNIWVTAKRPNANGTTNGFTTQIGAGGSGYGTGHSPQVNERPLSTTNGWSMIGAGSAVTEEYNIENTSTGDIDISTATIVDWLGWVSVKSLVAETINVILNGANVSQAITSTITMYKRVKGSATYPSGTGADIGIQTDTSLTTVSLYECGVVVAYIPAVITSFATKLLLVGTGKN